MNILIDTTSLTQGGGQKVAWNFINELLDHPRENHSFSFFCARGTAIHDALLDRGAENVCAAPASTGGRILWQLTEAPRLLRRIRPDVIYLMFGACLYPRRYCQVCGEADSNLFFPEVDFWSEYSGLKKKWKCLKDYYRVFMLKRADGIIFENQAMLERCKKLYPELKDRICFIKPSISKRDEKQNPPQTENKNFFSLLMLCSWQPNKNYAVMPAVLRILKDRNIPVKLSFSVGWEDQNAEAKKFHALLKKYDVEDLVEFLGTVPPHAIPETYEKTDAVLLLSKLESFSNNIIEAWKFGRPIIVSDMEWSRSIIGDAGCFVNRDDPADIADAVEKIASDKVYRDSLIRQGTEMLQCYPDISQHVDMVMDFLKKVGKK